ncbi:MAG: ankyrin repeat domain-containing protein [Nitrospira sp.]|nr:ankyrin repeat domain-containing protein [Nitrospira sp.]
MTHKTIAVFAGFLVAVWAVLFVLPYGGLFQPLLVRAAGFSDQSQCHAIPSDRNRFLSNTAYRFITLSPSLAQGFRNIENTLIAFSIGQIKCRSGLPGFAEESGRVNRMIDLALASGERVNDIGPLGVPNLHFAVSSGNHLVVEHLLKNGARVDQAVPESTEFATKGDTPLTLARRLKDENITDTSLIIRLLEQYQSFKQQVP